jgi:NAD(P)-dependent dehydrogenase (short-subunit alcohol dehydrogenase family)
MSPQQNSSSAGATSGELRFDDQVVLITGAGRGLGRAYALEFAARGAAVVVNDLGVAVDGTSPDHAAAEEVVATISRTGGNALADFSDVSTESGAHTMLGNALNAFGRLDVVVNNAGILRNAEYSLMTESEWSVVLRVHLNGTHWVTHASWPVMVRQGYGRVVNTTSLAAYVGIGGQASYAAAKAGIIGFTKSIAVDGAPNGIKVNCVAPGAKTRMMGDSGLGHLPAPPEIVEAVAYLQPSLVVPIVIVLSHEQCPVTGEIFAAVGGRVARVAIFETDGVYSNDLTAEEVLMRFDDISEATSLRTVTEVGDHIRDIIRLHSSR